MQNLKSMLKQFQTLKWYYQLLSILITLLSLVLLMKFLNWIIPIILGILALLFIFTEGEIFYDIWSSYKQRKQVPSNPLFTTVYHYLTEQGIVGLPISTMIFTQGVEFPDNTQGIYFIHLSKQISEELLADFEIKLRQTVKTLSNGEMDCVISLSKHEPYLAIKVRLVNSDDMLLKTIQSEEDF